MKERGMIFNGEMVRAILDGRKTQTRRIMKVQPEPSKTRKGDYWFPSNKVQSMVHVLDFTPGNCVIPDAHEFFSTCCPFGAVGDRIWGRETWQAIHEELNDDGYVDETTYAPAISKERDNYWYPVYAADNWCEDREQRGFPWRPAIHQPRWASRILLEITAVRVERLRSMSQDDARAEGVIAASGPMEAGLAFRELWDSIYGEESWKANPWVWVIEFKVVPNVPANSTGSDIR